MVTVMLACTANAVWVHVKLDTLKRSAEAHFVEKVECLNGIKCCLLYCDLPVLLLDIKKRILTTNGNTCTTTLLGVVAQAFRQRLICLLLSHGCR